MTIQHNEMGVLASRFFCNSSQFSHPRPDFWSCPSRFLKTQRESVYNHKKILKILACGALSLKNLAFHSEISRLFKPVSHSRRTERASIAAGLKGLREHWWVANTNFLQVRKLLLNITQYSLTNTTHTEVFKIKICFIKNILRTSEYCLKPFRTVLRKTQHPKTQVDPHLCENQNW